MLVHMMKGLQSAAFFTITRIPSYKEFSSVIPSQYASTYNHLEAKDRRKGVRKNLPNTHIFPNKKRSTQSRCDN
jgi:hypothetical protein